MIDDERPAVFVFVFVFVLFSLVVILECLQRARGLWSEALQVDRIFGAARRLQGLRCCPTRLLLPVLFGVLLACKFYLLPVLRCSWASPPDGITSIGSEEGRRLCQACTDVTLPASVTSIGDHAFIGCRSLFSISLPAGLTSIGDGVFNGCQSLASVTLPAGLTSIGDRAFGACMSLTSVTLPASITSIGDHAFEYCLSLASITLPGGLISIGDDAFYNCRSLASITLPDGLTSIGASAFARCSHLARVNVPPGCAIGARAFAGTSGGYVMGFRD